jgi:basic membrane lipoprotein Med (substrate-binding protein (PBP1-ABC) superfamily)
VRTGRGTAWLLALLAALVLGPGAACGGDDDDEAAAETTTAATAEEGGGKEVRAGLVSDVGRFNDRSFNQSALEGLNRAESELGADIRAVESRAAGDYVPNLSTLALQITTSRSASASSSPRAWRLWQSSSPLRTSQSSTTR